MVPISATYIVMNAAAPTAEITSNAGVTAGSFRTHMRIAMPDTAQARSASATGVGQADIARRGALASGAQEGAQLTRLRTSVRHVGHAPHHAVIRGDQGGPVGTRIDPAF